MFYVFIEAEILGCLWFFIGDLQEHPIDGFSPGSHHVLQMARCKLNLANETVAACTTVDLLPPGDAFLWSLHWGCTALLSMGVNLLPKNKVRHSPLSQ